MKQLSLLVPLILLLSACSTTRAPSLNMLEKEADYMDEHKINSQLERIESPLMSPSRVEAKTTDVLIHPHEMPTGDYFRGGWIRIIVNQPRWEMNSSTPLLKKDKKKSKKGK